MARNVFRATLIFYLSLEIVFDSFVSCEDIHDDKFYSTSLDVKRNESRVAIDQEGNFIAVAPSQLDQARAVAHSAPRAESQRGGELEDASWWEDNADLFVAARLEWGRKEPQLYTFDEGFERLYIEQRVVQVVKETRAAAAALDRATIELIYASSDSSAASAGVMAARERLSRAEAAVLSLTQKTAAAGVHRLRLFTPAFCTALLAELEHWEESGVPQRRPNGMNR